MLLSQLCFPNPSTFFLPSIKGELLENWDVATGTSSCTSGEIMWQEKGLREADLHFELTSPLFMAGGCSCRLKLFDASKGKELSSSLECLGKTPCALQSCGSTTPNFSSVAAVCDSLLRIKARAQEQVLSQTATHSLEFTQDPYVHWFPREFPFLQRDLALKPELSMKPRWSGLCFHISESFRCNLSHKTRIPARWEVGRKDSTLTLRFYFQQRFPWMSAPIQVSLVGLW